jgi:hypothetical protein
MKFPDPPDGADLLDQVIDVVGVQQPAARDQALRTALAHGARALPDGTRPAMTLRAIPYSHVRGPPKDLQ